MSRPEFAVKVADLEDGPKQLDCVISEAWQRHILADSQAEPRSPGRLRVELAKNGRDVLVRGHVEVSVTMPCVVTLEPLSFDLKPEVMLLLVPAEGAAGRRKAPAPARASAQGRPAKKTKLKAWEEPELDPEDAARDTFSGEEVVLDDFVREFILLELPMYPRRSDLPSAGDAAIAPAPQPEGPAPLDPRLRPLADLAKRLQSKEENKE